jgi:carboxypeptidase C (cathepsin A)
MNPLYIAGDSYSGLIIPTLALEIDRSKLPSVTLYIRDFFLLGCTFEGVHMMELLLTLDICTICRHRTR